MNKKIWLFSYIAIPLVIIFSIAIGYFAGANKEKYRIDMTFYAIAWYIFSITVLRFLFVKCTGSNLKNKENDETL